MGFNLEINSDSFSFINSTFSFSLKAKSVDFLKNIGINTIATKTRAVTPINLSFSCWSIFQVYLNLNILLQLQQYEMIQ